MYGVVVMILTVNDNDLVSYRRPNKFQFFPGDLVTIVQCHPFKDKIGVAPTQRIANSSNLCDEVLLGRYYYVVTQ